MQPTNMEGPRCEGMGGHGATATTSSGDERPPLLHVTPHSSTDPRLRDVLLTTLNIGFAFYFPRSLSTIRKLERYSHHFRCSI